MQNLEKKLQRNIPKLYFYSFFQAFLIIIPVIVHFWQKKGLTLLEVFLLQGIFGAALIILDFPAGYLADIWGRKITMIVGSLGMRALFLVFGPLIGHILDTKGPDHTMVTLGYIYIAGIFFVAVPLLNQRKEFI